MPTLDPADHEAVIDFCKANAIGLVVVGPEAPLVAGLVDDLEKHGIRAFGPSAKAAQLEGSKGFTKDICAQFDIPTAAYARFNNAPKAKAYVRAKGAPIVVKADGLAAGKGVTVALSVEEACAAIDDCFEGAFGQAGAEVVVEEFLEGEEASLFALCDGHSAVLLGTAQDHKRVGEGDTGPNTGGMGAYSPAPVLDQETISEVMGEIIVPTLAAMHHKGMPFHGVLYAGLMLTADGPKLIEYNVRFGDPECQVLMPRLEVGPRGTARGRDRGRPAFARAAMVAAGGALRGDGGKGLSRRAGKRHGHSRHCRGGGGRRAGLPRRDRAK